MTTYDAADPRVRLAPAGDSASIAQASAAQAAAQYFRFADLTPQERDHRGDTWYVRGQNFVLSYSEVRGGWSAERRDQPDEYVVLLPDHATAACVEAEGAGVEVGGFHLVVVPAGHSRLTARGDGRIVRLFSIRSSDLASQALNSDAYLEPHQGVAPFEPWPSSSGAEAMHSYSLDVPRDDTKHFGRIFRCSTFMVNYLYPTVGPRDTTKMSPHTHPDFEQASLALDGDYFHHMRFPWGVDMASWMPDEHTFCPAPSLAIIPPGAIHTSQAVGTGSNQLVDIFCPPRLDFSQQPGWVLNGDDYPMLV